MSDTAVAERPATTDAPPLERVLNRVGHLLVTLRAQARVFDALAKDYAEQLGEFDVATMAARDSRAEIEAAIAQLETIKEHPHGD